ncbi:hypothetical protein VAA_04331 [Vibrio anguillarum 775]|nr:hypothetical protein VAA_04331 [Vibrio anguillarum 775]AGU59930.1 hypothetical protein N175_19165 [Vibrio anguillarum M3]
MSRLLGQLIDTDTFKTKEQGFFANQNKLTDSFINQNAESTKKQKNSN